MLSIQKLVCLQRCTSPRESRRTGKQKNHFSRVTMQRANLSLLGERNVSASIVGVRTRIFRDLAALHHSSSSRKIHSTVASWPTTRLIVRRQSASALPLLRSISISAPSRLCRAFRYRVSSVNPRAFLMLSIRVSVIRRPHCEPQDRVIPPDNGGNWARARSMGRCIFSHTCIERTSCRTGAGVVQRRIADRSSPQRGGKHRSS